MNKNIEIRGAATHNLKKVNLDIPREKVVAFTGVSGSGKSSLVFDTIYTEAQRQLIETFSSFARRRLPKLSRPPVDEIRNLATAIVIDQKRMGANLRSTVGTATELASYLRLLFSRLGKPFIGPSFYFSYNNPEGMCPECHGFGYKIRVHTRLLLDRSLSLREGAVRHPDYKPDGWMWREIMVMDLFDVDQPLSSWAPGDIDRLLYAEKIPVKKRHGAGIYSKYFVGIARKLEERYLRKGEITLSEARKNAYDKFFIEDLCTVCAGSRINERARSVTLEGRTIAELCDLDIEELDAFLAGINGDIATPLVDKMRRVLSSLIRIGVGYLSLNRPVETLSGGESQRVKMARQLDCDLTGLLYIMDEPSIGLHPRDIDKLVELLRELRNRGNSVLVVEHDPGVVTAADWVVDIGPVAGKGGGEVLFNGPLTDLSKADTVTSHALYRSREADSISERRQPAGWYVIENAKVNNLRNLDVRIPAGVFTCITGVAGSGKSSLIHDEFCRRYPEAIVVDQSPVGRSSRSNPATYVKVFDDIRKAFAAANGVKASLFSFNSAGACEKCNGLGYLKVDMSFLDDVIMVCDRCEGRRYTDEVLAFTLDGKNIDDVLCMTIDEALAFFKQAKIKNGWRLWAMWVWDTSSLDNHCQPCPEEKLNVSNLHPSFTKREISM